MFSVKFKYLYSIDVNHQGFFFVCLFYHQFINKVRVYVLFWSITLKTHEKKNYLGYIYIHLCGFFNILMLEAIGIRSIFY